MKEFCNSKLSEEIKTESPASQELARLLGELVAIGQATLQSFERLQGAVIAQELPYIALQAEALHSHLSLFSEKQLFLPETIARFADELEVTISATPQEHLDFYNDLLLNGLSLELEATLRQRGLSDSDIATIHGMLQTSVPLEEVGSSLRSLSADFMRAMDNDVQESLDESLTLLDDLYLGMTESLRILREGNRPPLANAGTDRVVHSTASPTSITLDASASFDPDSDQLSYVWRWDAGTAIGQYSSAFFVYGCTKVTLTVTDSMGQSSSDSMVVSITTDQPTMPFIRGDTNDDSAVDISDAIATLGYLFKGTDYVCCLDAADVNDSGEVDISDPITLLGYLFLGTSAISPPFPIDFPHLT